MTKSASVIRNFVAKIKHRVGTHFGFHTGECNSLEGIEQCNEAERRFIGLVPRDYKPKFIAAFIATRSQEKQIQTVFDQFSSLTYYSEEV